MSFMERLDHTLVLTVLLVSALLQACVSSNKAIASGRVSVEQFRSHWRGDRYLEIYLDSDQAFRDKVTKDEFIEFGKKMRGQLGDVLQSRLVEERVNYNENGTMVLLHYETRFLRGEAYERFAWLIKGDKSYLYNYAIHLKLPLEGEQPPAQSRGTSVH